MAAKKAGAHAGEEVKSANYTYRDEKIIGNGSFGTVYQYTQYANQQQQQQQQPAS